MVHLVDLPTDVIYHIVSQMQLQDAWSLTAVSHTFRGLTTDRSFWLNALKSIPRMRSVFSPLILADLDPPALKQFALHSLRLEHNWSLPRPRILGTIRKWHLGDRPMLETNHLLQFPASELFIFYSSKLLKCFDCGTGESQTVLDLDAYVRCASYDLLPDNSIIIGLALTGGPRFNVSRIVGVVQSHGAVTEILAYDLISGGSTVIGTDIPINYAISRRLNFSFYQDNLYLLADDGPKALVYCCPKDSLPYGQHSATTSTLTFGDLDPVSFPTKIWKRRGPVCSQMLRNATFVKIHDSLGIPLSKFVTTFRFWQRAYAHLDLGPTALCTEITLEGMCSGELTMHIGSTGHHVVASLLNLGQTGTRLVLVRFDPDSNSCSSHELELPDGVGTGPPPNVLGVDDHTITPNGSEFAQWV
ncbi:hypothetical protein B0H19DRAFT_1246133 [Mycena capillaripes]|nr:hypothetical protein B0H19DRAFT_1246133 [Mycena capillaripes]